MPSATQLSRIGKYRLIASLGKGGMAHVHLALMAGPAGFNKLLVIKALREEMASSADEFVTMFLDEARLAARLNHPNVVQTYEVGEADGRFFIAMEYLEGQTLRTVARRLTPDALPLEAHLRVLSEVARGLHHAHELSSFDGEPLGVVHRDVSPQNVFLTFDGQVKLLDFGIAKTADAEHFTQIGVIKGKADYIAPEQIRGEDVDRQADVFSLGAMLWECLTGKRFAGGSEVGEVTKMHHRLTGKEPRVREVAPDVPERLAAICDRATALDPGDRQPDAASFGREIDAFLADTGLHPSAEQLSRIVAPPFERERRRLRQLIDEQVQLAKKPDTTFDAGTGRLPVLGGPRAAPAEASGLQDRTPPADPAPTVQPRRRGASFRVAAFVSLAAVALGGYLASRTESAAEGARGSDRQGGESVAGIVPEPTPVAPPRAPQPAAPEAELPARVHVRIHTAPTDARLLLDGEELGRTPFEADLARAEAVRELTIEARGFEPKTRLLTLDRDQDLELVLDPVVQRRFRRRAAAAARREAAADQGQAQGEAEKAPAPDPPAAEEEQRPELEPGMDLLNVPSRRKERLDLITEDPYQ